MEHHRVKSFLTNRKQYVSINGSGSKKISIATRVLQGSVLSPLFFLVYVSDLARCSNFDILTYADDTVVTVSSNIIPNLTEIAKFDLRKVQKWYEVNKLTLNINKTQSLFFDKRSNINNYSISANKYVKYLGLLLNNQLSWQHHTDFVVNKPCIALGIFPRLKYYVP